MDRRKTLASVREKCDRKSRSAKKKSDKKVKPKLNAYAEIAKAYSGEDGSGKISDTSVRDEVLTQTIQEKALSLTTLRVVEESKSTGAPGAATSIFKYVGSTLSRDGSQLKSKLRGTAGLAWEGSNSQKTNSNQPGAGLEIERLRSMAEPMRCS